MKLILFLIALNQALAAKMLSKLENTIKNTNNYVEV